MVVLPARTSKNCDKCDPIKMLLKWWSKRKLVFQVDFDAISPLKIALSPTGSGNHVTFSFLVFFGISQKSLYIVKKSQCSSDLPIT